MKSPNAYVAPHSPVSEAELPRVAAGLDGLLKPQSVAVIGATERDGSVGAAVMRNMLNGGYRGLILPVNPNRKRVFGVPAVAGITDGPPSIDLAVVCTPAASVPLIVRQCGEHGVKAMLIITAGFREIGAAGVALEIAIREQLLAFRTCASSVRIAWG